MGKPSTRNPSARPRNPGETLYVSRHTRRDCESRLGVSLLLLQQGLGQSMASMRNGSGDDYFILFSSAGTAIKGYAREYPMANPGHPPDAVLDGFPPSIEDFLSEPAFTMDCTTFCIWHLPAA